MQLVAVVERTQSVLRFLAECPPPSGVLQLGTALSKRVPAVVHVLEHCDASQLALKRPALHLLIRHELQRTVAHADQQ
jgi:hypothetical protein